jgi:hypothetical protein
MTKLRGVGKVESGFLLGIGIDFGPGQGIAIVEPFNEVAVAAAG